MRQPEDQFTQVKRIFSSKGSYVVCAWLDLILRRHLTAGEIQMLKHESLWMEYDSNAVWQSLQYYLASQLGGLLRRPCL